MATKYDVTQFLQEFFAKYRVFGILFRDHRQKNGKALLSLEISPGQRREIIENLQVEDYSQGPLDDTLYGIASMWVFGKTINETEGYIKISMGAYSAPVVCISFHGAENAMRYPFKNIQP